MKAAKGCMDYGLHVAVTSWDETTADVMEWLTTQGVNSFKFYMTFRSAPLVNDEMLLQGLATCARLQALPMVRA